MDEVFRYVCNYLNKKEKKGKKERIYIIVFNSAETAYTYVHKRLVVRIKLRKFAGKFHEKYYNNKHDD
jgi:hypothetical protein